LQLEPRDVAALATLTRLCEEERAWGRAVALYLTRAALVPREEQAALYARAAALSSERLGDDDAAESHYARALEADPRHVLSLTGLAQLYRRRGELRKAARLLADAVESTQNRVVRTRLYVDAAELHERFDDAAGAITLYQRALELDPEHVDAAARASELLWAAGRWAELTSVLALLVARDAVPAVALPRWSRLGAAARASGDAALAERAWRRALALAADDRESLRGLASLLFDAHRFAEAQPLYEALLRAHERALPPDDQVTAHHALGVCYRAAGNDAAARTEFALACAIDPTHRPSRLMQLELGTQDPAAVIDAKKALLPTSGRAEQLRLFLEIGDLYLDRFDDPVQSVGAWEAGLRVAPDDVRLLHRLLGVFIEQKAWGQALGVLDRLIRDQPKPETRAKYHYTAGMICLEHLGRFADASEHLWSSVEGDPGYKRAAVALEEMLRKHKSWKELARFYQFVLQKLEPIDSDSKRAEQLRMWSELGELYFARLHDADSAVVALEVARRLEPTARRRQQLATVCTAAGGRHLALAMEEHRALLAEDKARIASYRALKERCLETGRPDEAAACAEALTCLKPDEEEVPATAPVEPRRPLTPELLARLRHPDESVELAALFSIVAPQVAARRAARERTPLVRQRLLAADDARPIARALMRAASAFGLGAPAVSIAPNQVAPVALACAVDGQQVTPLLLLSASLVADSHGEVELLFDVARAVTQLRPELLIRLLLPLPAELAHLVEAAMALAGETSGDAATGELGKTTQALKSGLPAAALDQLAAIGHRLRVRGTRPQAAALRWLQASDLGVNRAALVVAGDVRRCARVLKDEPPPATALDAPHRVLDLIWSSATDEVLTARRHLAG
ncbi:MAG: tetratricopeptide repeat protein, partial [Polyangia bacterium]